MMKEVRTELFGLWKYLFVIQLVIGGHAVYELAAEYPDIGFFQYSILLVVGASLIAAILLAIALIIFLFCAGCFVGIQVWKERKHDAS